MVLKILFLFLIMTAPHFSWGFSSQRTTEYKQQALKKNLATSNAWLRLGHYRKSLTHTWAGAYHSPLLGDFFISSKGNTDPEAELLATIDRLFSESSAKQHPQCRYLARTAWLKTALNISSEDLISCPERDQWKAQLGVREVYLIFAASDLSSAASSFGHTFLRFHNPKNTGKLDLLDYGVNYAAVTGSEDGALYALKGLFGFYPGSYSMLPYHQKIREYTNLEGRDLWEYKIRLTPEEVEMMINHLLELEGSYAPYYFADDNCSAQILELIEVARPEADLTESFSDIIIPLDTVKVLAQFWMLESEKVRPSLQTEWHTRYSYLDLSEKKALRDIIQTGSLNEKSYELLDRRSKALSLEASLSYLALTDYRQQKESKDKKYSLSVARAQLGPITEPLKIPDPQSPLWSPDTMALYLGYGQQEQVDFYSFKWRRGFHDLLSDDSGLAPFSQLDFLSFDLHYKPTKQSWDLQQMDLLNIISTYPWTEFEKPLSWKLDIGTEPKLAPFANGGIGLGMDLPLPMAARWALFAISENDHLTETANPHLGAESLLINKWTARWRSVLDAKYLYSTSEGRSLGDFSLGLSYSFYRIEYRLEGRIRDNQDSWQFSVIF